MNSQILQLQLMILLKISVTTNDCTRNLSYNFETCYEFTNILVTTNDFTKNVSYN